jgi:hypothetical protein
MMLKNLLIYRSAVIDICGTAALVWAWQLGFVGMVIEGDQSYICLLTFAVFLFAKACAWRETIKVSRGLNRLKSTRLQALMNSDKAMAKIDYLFDFPAMLQTLGLLGTVVGLLIGLHDIKGMSGDTEATIWQLMGGLSTAFFTTAVGIILAEWVKLQIRPVNTSLVSLIEDNR